MGRNFLAFVTIALVFAACVPYGGNHADAVSSATVRKGQPSRILLRRIMPDAAADGVVKVAVLVNQKAGDNSRQFIEGCVSEGRSMGFTVDAFVTGGDAAKCSAVAAGIARADYDGLVFAYGAMDFSYDILKPASDDGKQVVTFEALPFRDGLRIKNLAATFQDDYRLARLSLDTLVSYGRIPVRVIRVACDPGITFLDRRAWEFDQFVRSGKIIEVDRITLGSLDNPCSDAREAVAAILPHYPPGTVDALWVPWDEFASGSAAALDSAGRNDIKLFSIGISSESIRLMQRYADIWIANTAVDPKLEGIVTTRILAAKLAGVEFNETYLFNPQLIKTEYLNPAVNVVNISVIVPDWEDGSGLFDDYRWMKDLKEAEANYLRLSPESLPPEAAP